MIGTILISPIKVSFICLVKRDSSQLTLTIDTTLFTDISLREPGVIGGPSRTTSKSYKFKYLLFVPSIRGQPFHWKKTRKSWRRRVFKVDPEKTKEGKSVWFKKKKKLTSKTLCSLTFSSGSTGVSMWVTRQKGGGAGRKKEEAQHTAQLLFSW